MKAKHRNIMKAKHRNRKALSFILAVIMIVGMIPMGSFGIFAEGITVPSENEEGSQTYIIKTADDWAAVAAASATNDFEGDTVKLGANIGGTKDSPIELAPLFRGAFKGTFDGGYNAETGEGFVISYVNITSSLIATIADGNAVIQNVKFDNVSLTTTKTSLNYDVGLVVGEAKGSTKLENVAVVNSIVDTTTSYCGAVLMAKVGGTSGVSVKNCRITDTTVIGCGYTGLMAGYMNGSITVDGLVTEGCAITYVSNSGSVAHVGGLIGRMSADNKAVVKITNSSIDVDISDTLTGNHNRSMGLVIGGMESSSLEISNSTVTGSIESYALPIGGLIGTAKVNSGRYLRVMNVTVDADLTSKNTTNTAGGTYAVAGGIAILNTPLNNEGGEILFDRVKIMGTFEAPQCKVGGVIGYCEGVKTTDTDEATILANTVDIGVTIRRCEITPTLKNPSAGRYVGVGMIVAQWGYNTRYSTGYAYNTGALTVEETFIGGVLDHKQSIVWSGAIGCLAFKKCNVVFNNCVFATDMSKCKLNGNAAGGTGLIVGMSDSRSNTAVVTVNNCVTTQTGTMGTDWHMMNYVTGNLMFNGITYSNKGKQSDNSVLVIDSTKLGTMVERDSAGYITCIGGQITGGYLQTTGKYSGKDAEGNTVDSYAVRFIALSQVAEPAGAGITVVVKDSNGNVVKTFDTVECLTYDNLKAYSPVDGAELTTYNATEFGATQFFAIIIENIPTGEAYSFEVTPHYQRGGNIVVYGITQTARFDAEGNLINSVS